MFTKLKIFFLSSEPFRNKALGVYKVLMSRFEIEYGHDDNMDFLKELDNETPQEISERERILRRMWI